MIESRSYSTEPDGILVPCATKLEVYLVGYRLGRRIRFAFEYAAVHLFMFGRIVPIVEAFPITQGIYFSFNIKGIASDATKCPRLNLFKTVASAQPQVQLP